MTASFLDWAIKYADMGFAVFPLKPKDKIPLTRNGFKDASKEQEQIIDWWTRCPDANIGIATGQVSGGLVVIDLDKHEDIDGEESLDDWQDDNGPFPETWTAITGSLGRHILVKSDSEIRNGTGVLGKDSGVDIRGDGGYIVAPPSIHPITGRSYEWEYTWEDCQLAEISKDSTLEFFFSTLSNRNSNNGESKQLSIPDVINEGGRNDMLYRLACSLQAQSLSDQAIEATVMAENDAKCNPPLPYAEVKRIVESACRNKKGLSDEYQKTKDDAKARKTEESEKPKPTQFPEMDRANDLRQEKMDDLRVLVGVGEECPFLLEGTCILSAKSKLGKSWLALELCNAVASGKDFLGYKTEKCHTLYLDLETKRNLKQKRLNKLKNAVGEISNDFMIVGDACVLGEGFEEQIEHYISQDPLIGIVVVDVFQKILKPKKSTENDYEYYYEKIGRLNKIAEKYHISIILVTHDRKTVDASDPFSNILGSTALQGATDQMIVMFKPKYNDADTNIVVRGRTIDGLVELKAHFENSVWTKSNYVPGDSEKTERLNEYLNSDIRAAVKTILLNCDEWKGRCGQLIDAGAEFGIGIEESTKEIGGFLCKNIGYFLKEDNIKIERIKNGTGASLYKISTFTVDTVDEEWLTVDENPFKPL